MNHQEAMVTLIDRLVVRDADGARLLDLLPMDDYQESLENSIEAMYGSAAANATVQEFRDSLIREAYYGDLYEVIASVSGWPGDMPDDPQLDEDMYTSWSARREALLTRWGLARSDTYGLQYLPVAMKKRENWMVNHSVPQSVVDFVFAEIVRG